MLWAWRVHCLRQLWLNCYLLQLSLHTSERGVSEVPKQNTCLKKTQASQRGCEQQGGKKKPQSCWAYVSFNSLIHATRVTKQRAERGRQGAFRSVGRNAFWISEGRSQLVKSQWCCWQDEPAEHLDKESFWGMIFQKHPSRFKRTLILTGF